MGADIRDTIVNLEIFLLLDECLRSIECIATCIK